MMHCIAGSAVVCCSLNSAVLIMHCHKPTNIATLLAPMMFCTAQVGQYEVGEQAARARDLAVIGTGMASQPKLNFPAPSYRLSEVLAVVGALRAKHPQHFG